MTRKSLIGGIKTTKEIEERIANNLNNINQNLVSLIETIDKLVNKIEKVTSPSDCLDIRIIENLSKDR